MLKGALAGFFLRLDRRIQDTKLLQLVLTAALASVERSCQALKRLKKTSSRNRAEQGRLSSLAMISAETKRLLKLKDKARTSSMIK